MSTQPDLPHEPTGRPTPNELSDRLAGTLLGAALGDALGIAAEGMSARAIARRCGRVERYHLALCHPT
jgi:ADP-ribosylglycohydrolase